MAKHWYNNGLIQKQYKEDDVPEGWSLGMLPKSEETLRIANEKKKQTWFNKYGVTNIWDLEETREKSKRTSLERYGTESPNQSEAVREKQKNSMIERYGVEHALQSKELHDKAVKTTQERYGVDYGVQSSEIRERQKNTLREHFGVDNPSKSEEIQKKKSETYLRRYGAEQYCQSEDFKEKARKTLNERYGVDNASKSEEIKEKKRKTTKSNFGVDYPFQSEEIMKKSQDTLYEHYGVRNPIKSDVIRAKMKQTCLDRYGNEYAIASNYVREASKQTMKEHYGVEHALQSEEIFNKMRENNLKVWGVEYPITLEECKEKARQTNLERYGYEWAFMDPKYRTGYSKCNSKVNIEFASLLESYGIEYEQEFYINRYYYDFKVGNILIELDPYPTHNSLWGIFNKEFGISPDYHFEKSHVAESRGYQVIHIFDWDSKEKVIESILLDRDVVYARKTRLTEISIEETNQFLLKNHIQGSCNGQSVILGLKDGEGELLSLMSFGKPRYNKNYQWELLRYASKKAVIGGAQKLFRHFIKTYNPESIISYCDRSKFRGDIYPNLGFRLINAGKPSKHWYDPDSKRHITDNLLRQRGFDQLFNTNFGKGTSNEELIISQGFVSIYDCGQDTYVYSNS